MTRLHTRALPVGAPEGASFGYGTAFLRVPGTMQLLFSYLEGARVRLVRWDLASGAWNAIPTCGLLAA